MDTNATLELKGISHALTSIQDELQGIRKDLNRAILCPSSRWLPEHSDHPPSPFKSRRAEFSASVAGGPICNEQSLERCDAPSPRKSRTVGASAVTTFAEVVTDLDDLDSDNAKDAIVNRSLESSNKPFQDASMLRAGGLRRSASQNSIPGALLSSEAGSDAGTRPMRVSTTKGNVVWTDGSAHLSMRDVLHSDMLDIMAHQDVDGNVWLDLENLQIKNESVLESDRKFISRFVLEPASRARLTIDVASLAVLMYDLVLTPYLLAWDVEIGGGLAYATYAVVCFWIMDVILSCRTGFYTSSGLEMRPHKIFIHYLKRTFLVDCCVIATDVFALIAARDQADGNGQLPTDVLRFTKIGRVLRLIGVLRVSHLAEIFCRLSVRYAGLGAGLNIFVIMFAMVYINHVIACVWYYVGVTAVSDTGSHWLDEIGTLTGDSYREVQILYQYTTSFHFSLTQMTPGSMQVFGVNSTERVVTIICLLFGLLTFGTLVSSLSTMMMDIRRQAEQQVQQMTLLRRYLRVLAVPERMAFAIEQSVQSRLRHQKPMTHHDVDALDLLSAQQRCDLDVQVYFPHLKPLPILRICCFLDQGLIRKLVRVALDMTFFDSSTLLFDSGQEAVAMYFVTQGAVDYSVEAHENINNSRYSLEADKEPTSVKVPEGGVLTEAALWSEWRHVGTAVPTIGGSVIVQLNAVEFASVVSRRTLIRDLICEYASLFCGGPCARLHYRAKAVTEREPDDVHSVSSSEDIFLAMANPCRVVCSLAATGMLKLKEDKRGSFVGAWPMRRRGWESLAAEVHAGRSSVILAPTGEIRRIASIACFEIIRSDDGKVFAQLGRLHGRAVVPSCTLPGTKLPDPREAGAVKHGLTPLITEGELQCFKQAWACNDLLLGAVVQEEFWQASDKYGVLTKYRRYVQQAQLSGASLVKELPCTVPIFPDQVEHVATKVKSFGNMVASWQPSGVFKHSSMRRASELEWFPEAMLCFGHEEGPLICAWLQREEFEMWRQPNKQATLLRVLDRLPLEAAFSSASVMSIHGGDAIHGGEGTTSWV